MGAVMQIIGGSLLFSTSNAPLAADGPLNVVRFRDTEDSDIAASSSALCGVTAVTGAGVQACTRNETIPGIVGSELLQIARAREHFCSGVTFKNLTAQLSDARACADRCIIGTSETKT